MKQRLHVPNQRGLTLVEVLVTAAIAGVILTGVVGAFIAQTRLYREQGSAREANQSARAAIAAIAERLGRAGYGLGSEFAFDFSWYDCSDGSYSGDAAVCAPASRDNAAYAGGNRIADQLVFAARNPRYFAQQDNLLNGLSTRGNAWEVTGASPTDLTLFGHQGDAFRRGQVLYVVCPGAYTYTYVTVGTTAQVPGTDPNAVQATNLKLMTQVADHPFKQNNALDAACFDTGLARAFAIDRYRFFVSMDTSDAQHPRPFLFLDRGMDMDLDGDIDDADLLTVAPDIEDLQVSYVTRAGSVFGTGAAPHQPATPAFDYQLAPRCSTEVTGWYGPRTLVPCRPTAPQRQADHPGNVVAVRLTVVARTPVQRSQDQGPRFGRPPGDFSAENHDRSNEARDGYDRVRLSTTIELPNMGSRGIPLI